MNSISDIQKKIENEINLLFAEIKKQPKELYAPISYTMQLGGKRMRPALLLLSCEMFGGKIKDAIPAAIAIEVFHNFSLVHDDIMDNAPLRRSKPTVHKKWNSNIAILSGDVMLVQAYQQLAKTNSKNLLQLFESFNTTAIEVCEGQQMDMNFETQKNVSIADYIKMIELKTAVLLAASLKMGALIANTSEKNANLIYDFGRNMGIAFQLHDDILDLYGDTQKVGKQQGGDIIANKKTYLLLKALEFSNSTKKKELVRWINKKSFAPQKKVKAVKKIFDSLQIKSYAEKEMTNYFNKAISALQKISVSENLKQPLFYFAESLMQREK